MTQADPATPAPPVYPTLAFTLGQEYGRSSGNLPVNADFCGQAAADGHPPHVVDSVSWSYTPDANLEAPVDNVESFPQRIIARHFIQGSEPINGLSFHLFAPGTLSQAIALMGIPLEPLTGHYLTIRSICKAATPPTRHFQRYDLAFVADPQNPPDHPVSSIGPGHYHIDPADFRRLQARVAALEWKEKAVGSS